MVSQEDFYIAYLALKERDVEERNIRFLCSRLSKNPMCHCVEISDRIFMWKPISWGHSCKSWSLVVLCCFFASRCAEELCRWPSWRVLRDVPVLAQRRGRAPARPEQPPAPASAGPSTAGGLVLPVLLLLTSAEGHPLRPLRTQHLLVCWTTNS